MCGRAHDRRCRAVRTHRRRTHTHEPAWHTSTLPPPSTAPIAWRAQCYVASMLMALAALMWPTSCSTTPLPSPLCGSTCVPRALESSPGRITVGSFNSFISAAAVSTASRPAAAKPAALAVAAASCLAASRPITTEPFALALAAAAATSRPVAAKPVALAAAISPAAVSSASRPIAAEPAALATAGTALATATVSIAAALEVSAASDRRLFVFGTLPPCDRGSSSALAPKREAVDGGVLLPHHDLRIAAAAASSRPVAAKPVALAAAISTALATTGAAPATAAAPSNAAAMSIAAAPIARFVWDLARARTRLAVTAVVVMNFLFVHPAFAITSVLSPQLMLRSRLGFNTRPGFGRELVDSAALAPAAAVSAVAPSRATAEPAAALPTAALSVTAISAALPTTISAVLAAAPLATAAAPSDAAAVSIAAALATAANSATVLRTPSIACDAATRTVFIEVLGDFMVCLLPSLCMLCIWPALRPNTYVVYLDDGRQPHGWQRNWRRYCAEMRSHRKAIAALHRIEKRRAYQRKRRFFSVIGKEWAFEVGKQCQLRVPKGIRNIASTEIKSEVSNSNTKSGEAFEYVDALRKPCLFTHFRRRSARRQEGRLFASCLRGRHHRTHHELFVRGTRVTVAAASHLTTVAELREAVCDAYLAVCCRATTKLQAHWRGRQVRTAIKEHTASALPDPSPLAQYGGGSKESGNCGKFIRIAFGNDGVLWQSRDHPEFKKLIATGTKDSNRSTILNRELKKWLKPTDTTGVQVSIPTFGMRHARRLPLTPLSPPRLLLNRSRPKQNYLVRAAFASLIATVRARSSELHACGASRAAATNVMPLLATPTQSSAAQIATTPSMQAATAIGLRG